MRSPPKEEPFDQVQVEQDETAQMSDPGNNGLDTPPLESKITLTKTHANSHVDLPFPPPPLVYRRKFWSSDKQEQDAETKVVFNKTIGENYRNGRTGYLQVGVLFLTWEDDDLKCKSSEVDKLRSLLEDDFCFETEHLEIPSERSETDLMMKVSIFMSRYNNLDCLAIIYYGGHGYLGEKTNKFKLAVYVINLSKASKCSWNLSRSSPLISPKPLNLVPMATQLPFLPTYNYVCAQHHAISFLFSTANIPHKLLRPKKWGEDDLSS